MPLYPIDIEKRLKALQRQARHEAEGAPYVIYALLDPGEPGVQFEESPFNGTPFYVGQSCEIENRLRQHFRKPQKLNPDSQMVHRHIAGLFAIRRLPRLAILETAQTRSQSLMAELRWGQRLMRAGYELANTSADIQRLMGLPELEAWLDFRRSSMLASEAAHEGPSSSTGVPVVMWTGRSTRLTMRHAGPSGYGCAKLRSGPSNAQGAARNASGRLRIANFCRRTLPIEIHSALSLVTRMGSGM